MKGQMATEHMFVYAIVLLIILVSLGTMYYLVDVGAFKTPHCFLSAEISCDDFLVNETGASVVLVNNLGNPVQVTSVKLVAESGVSCDYNGRAITLPPQTPVIISTNENCILMNKGMHAKLGLEVRITYATGGLSHQVSGQIIT